MRAGGAIALARRAWPSTSHVTHGLVLRSVTRGSAPPARPVLSSQLQCGFSPAAAHVNPKVVFPRALVATGILGLPERSLSTEGSGAAAAAAVAEEEEAVQETSGEVTAELEEVLALVEEKKGQGVVVTTHSTPNQIWCLVQRRVPACACSAGCARLT